MIRLLVVLCLLSWPVNGQTTAGSAGWLAGLCSLKTPYCHTVVDAMLGTHTLISMRSPEATIFCAPRTPIGSEQARLIFLSWLNDYSNASDQPAVAVLFASLAEHYPCG